MIRRGTPGGVAAMLAAAVASVTAVAAEPAPTPLPTLGIDAAAISVSGISSGGFMAHQFHVAHSARVMGAGIIAGGPYACAGGGYPWNLLRALNVCSSIAPGPFRGPPDPQQAIAAVREAEQAEAIDASAGLRGDRVLLFSGRKDDLVPPPVVETVDAVYRAFDEASAIRMVGDVDAPHAMITAAFGNRCEANKTPFINNCGFDLAGAPCSVRSTARWGRRRRPRASSGRSRKPPSSIRGCSMAWPPAAGSTSRASAPAAAAACTWFCTAASRPRR